MGTRIMNRRTLQNRMTRTPLAMRNRMSLVASVIE